MIKSKKPKICANINCKKPFYPKYKSTEKHCSSSCYYSDADTDNSIKTNKVYKIPKFSKKRSKSSKVYSGKRIVFLSKPENKFCIIKGSNCTKLATTIEHSKGRIGFADDEARDKNISLYLDERFWLPACNNCNLELENNNELSQKFQLSKIHDGKKI